MPESLGRYESKSVTHIGKHLFPRKKKLRNKLTTLLYNVGLQICNVELHILCIALE